jgi:hypothetical protein
MPITRLECRVPKITNSDAGPRPTTQGGMMVYLIYISSTKLYEMVRRGAWGTRHC